MRIIYLLVVLLSLSGCFGLNVKTEPEEKPRLSIKNPDPIQLTDIKFVVVTKDNIDKILKDLETKGTKPILLGISVADYKVLAMNIEQIKVYIILLQNILDKYRTYYEPSNKVIPIAPFKSFAK